MVQCTSLYVNNGQPVGLDVCVCVVGSRVYSVDGKGRGGCGEAEVGEQSQEGRNQISCRLSDMTQIWTDEQM